ncbi:MAG: aquaporin family protein [Dermatophilaceae bacterium]|nr:aquaporin family protein [Dermatophilaceae bacterium]
MGVLPVQPDRDVVAGDAHLRHRLVRLRQKAAAELVGTGFLVATVIGSGIAASRLSPGNIGLQLLEYSLATGAVLVALILALHPVSASFNPVVTLVERVLGTISTRTAAALVAAQVAGGLAGAVVANLMFDLPAVTLSQHARSGSGLWLGEVVATLGLVVVVLGTLRGADSSRVAYAVGGYIAAAYWFTSSTSFANPAVTLARTVTDTFAGIAPSSVLAFVLAQLLGGALGLGAVALLHPVGRTAPPARKALP